MKLKNVTAKVIGIGTNYVMPDSVVDIDDATAKLPAIEM